MVRVYWQGGNQVNSSRCNTNEKGESDERSPISHSVHKSSRRWERVVDSQLKDCHRHRPETRRLCALELNKENNRISFSYSAFIREPFVVCLHLTLPVWALTSNWIEYIRPISRIFFLNMKPLCFLSCLFVCAWVHDDVF